MNVNGNQRGIQIVKYNIRKAISHLLLSIQIIDENRQINVISYVNLPCVIQ